jgi:hypothetical protein
MVARSEACTVFDSPNTGIVCSNPKRVMDICVSTVLILLVVGTDLALGDPPSRVSYQLPIIFIVSETNPSLEHDRGSNL